MRLPRCEWHQDEIDLNDAVQNGKRFKCKNCYSTERFLQNKYKRDNQSHVWQSMSADERREMILKNRERSGGRGNKREFVINERSTVSDAVTTGAKFPFKNRKQILSQNLVFAIVFVKLSVRFGDEITL